MNRLGHEGLRFMQTLNDMYEEKSRENVGLFKVLSENSNYNIAR